MPTKNVYSKLVELSNSGYEIVSDEPDIRNWKVTNANGKILGTVNELLVDKSSSKIRYIVLGLNGKPLNLLSRKMLIPIGIAELDESNDVVILPTVTIEHLATLPDYKKGKLTLDVERKIRNIFSSSNSADDYSNNIADDAFYNHEDFNDSNLRKRKEIGKQPNFSKEDEPAADDAKTGLTPFNEGVIEITENSEIPVVTKETRVVEEISLNKEVQERNEKIKDSVRSTDVEIEKFDTNDKYNQ